MTKIIILGSSNAVASEDHDNTHMVITAESRTVLVDCASSPLLRLKRAGVNFRSVSDLLLTHFHPDHVSGVPLLLMDMWLLGRREPLSIHGLDYTLERIERLMDLYGWAAWPDFYPVSFRRVPAAELAPVLDCAEFQLFSSPVKHLIPNIGLRIESRLSGKMVGYSCDTQPCAEVVRLAAGADILIHEAAGQGVGHSSAAQAGQVAREAEVNRLILIHYPTEKPSSTDLVRQARERFPGEIALAEDFMELSID